MFLTSKIGWAGMALTLLIVVMLVLVFPPSAVGSDSNKEGVPAFVTKNEISKMQATLRDKGHYRGKIDGDFGLQTRSSIRAYQKAEKLPINGEVDISTAEGLGVRPESSWDNSQSAGRPDPHSSASVAGKLKKDKPPAGIRRANGRSGTTGRKEVSRVTAMEDDRGRGANKQKSENQAHDQ
jgi:peptidoglycan hydrolase-like protein with peptidoglycan-binding domain